mgnify:CR=1 FL=1
MKLLALDTSTEYCSAALYAGGQVTSRGEHAGQRHSELLVPMVDALLRDAGISVRDLDAVAFAQGPGSFTGLRIACAVSQGLAFAAGIPVVPVGTLLALAEGSRDDRAICCTDARMNEVYFAAYERQGGEWTTVQEPVVTPPSAAPVPPGGGWTVCGNGFAAYREALQSRLQDAMSVVSEVQWPHASDVAVLGVSLYTAGNHVPASEAVPLYIRDKVALKTDERRR